MAGIACGFLRSPSQRVASGFYSAALTALGVARVIPIHVSRERPLRTADLTRATGVLVGGTSVSVGTGVCVSVGSTVDVSVGSGVSGGNARTMLVGAASNVPGSGVAG